MNTGTQIYLPFDEQVLTESSTKRRRNARRVVVGRLGSKTKPIEPEVNRPGEEQDLDLPASSRSPAADVVIDSVVGAGRTVDGLFSAVATVIDLLFLGGRIEDYPCLRSPRPNRTTRTDPNLN